MDFTETPKLDDSVNISVMGKHPMPHRSHSPHVATHTVFHLEAIAFICDTHRPVIAVVMLGVQICSDSVLFLIFMSFTPESLSLWTQQVLQEEVGEGCRAEGPQEVCLDLFFLPLRVC